MYEIEDNDVVFCCQAFQNLECSFWPHISRITKISRMPLKLFHAHHLHTLLPPTPNLLPSHLFTAPAALHLKNGAMMASTTRLRNRRQRFPTATFSASSAPLDLTEENIEQVLVEARIEASHLHLCNSIRDGTNHNIVTDYLTLRVLAAGTTLRRFS